jgi:hypothetical protein
MVASTFERRAVTPEVRRARRWTGLVALAAAAALLAGLVAVTGKDGDGGPAGSLGRVEPATYFGSFTQLAASDGGLWAWDEAGHLGRYEDGSWYRYADLPAETWFVDVAIGADGTVLVGTSSGLYRLDDGSWRRHPASPAGSVAVEVDPVTGAEWWATAAGLVRWDGTDAVPLPDPPSEMPEGVHDILAGGDGTLWLSGTLGYFPDQGGLARYHDDSRSWEVVRPLGGFDDLPADLARTPDGGLWAVLSDWSGDWSRLAAAGETYVEWSLAHFDSGSQRWTAYEPGPPDVYPLAMAADGDAVWLAQGSATMAELEDLEGVLRFDGETWTSYLDDRVVTAVAAAGDGTIWVSVLDEPGVTRLSTAAGAGHPTGYPVATVAPAPPPDAVVVSLGDSLTGAWAEGYARLVSDETGAAVAGLAIWEGGAVDLEALVRAHGDAVADADIVLLEVDPYPIFIDCAADRTCRTREITAYGGTLAAVLDDIIRLRAGSPSGVAVVGMGFWGGDGLVGPEFHGSAGWVAAMEDMQAWFEVVRAEAGERQVAVVDVNAELLGADYRGRMPSGLTTDGIHLSAAGNAEVARILAEHDETFGVTP